MHKARQTPSGLFLFLGVSALVHGVFLWLAPAGPRPAAVFREQGPRVALVNLPPPAPPRRANPRPPAPSAAPVPSAPERVTGAPEKTGPVYDGPLDDQAPEGEAGFPGTSAPAMDPSLREDAISRYLARIRGLIDKRKEYPYQARRQEQEGTVLIRFTVTRQGALAGEPVVEKRSRYERLNASALEAVKNAAPYPPFPGEFGEDEMSFQVAVAFSLK